MLCGNDTPYDLETPGHICVYGGTHTGKTYFIKYLINKYIQAGHYTKEQVHIFTTNAYQWEREYSKVYTEWSDIKEIKDDVIRDRKGLIIFDDFNEQVNTSTNPEYNALFTRGRHLGIRIMTVAHKPTSIGKDARESLLYAITGFSSNLQYIQELARYYYMNQQGKLREMIVELSQKGKYSMLVINKRTGHTFVDKAPSNCGDSELSPSFGNNVSNPNNNQQFGNNKTIYGVDSSQNLTNYNIDNKVDQHQQILQHQTNNKIRQMNYHFDRKMRLLKEKDECYDLCLKAYKSSEDIKRQIFLLNQFCQVSCVAHHNLEAYSKAFMNHYFPDVRYSTDFKKLSNSYGVVKSLIDKDYSTVGENLIGFLGNSKRLQWIKGIKFG